MLRTLLATALLVATPLFASIELGAPRTVVRAAGICPPADTRCLDAAGDATTQMLVWTYLAEGKPRVRASSGDAKSAPVELFVAGGDSPSVAWDGRDTFLAVWRDDSRYLGTNLYSATLSAHGEVLRRQVIHRETGAGQALWTGLEFAVALPTEVFFLGDGTSPRQVMVPTDWTGAFWVESTAAAVSGDAILTVGNHWEQALCPTEKTCFGRQQSVSTSIVRGSSATLSHELLPVWKFDPSERTALSVAAGGDGFLFVWQEQGDLMTMRLDQRGRRVGPKHVVAIAREAAASQVVSTRDGWLVVWDDLYTDTAWVAELDANGAMIGSAVQIPGNEVRSPVLVKLAGGQYRIFYRTGDAIESRTLDTEPKKPGRGRRRVVR